MITKKLLFAALTALLLSSSAFSADGPPIAPLSSFAQDSLVLDSHGMTHSFRVYLAITDAQHDQGLMFVKKLNPDHGMLFIFDQPQVTAFWMKNTLIPLDILFVAPNGRVIRVAPNAQPLSLESISSMGTILGVLELAGGTCDRLHIHTGDLVRYRTFQPS